MADVGLVDRLAALPELAKIPRSELEWLVEHGELETLAVGRVVAPQGEPIETLWIILSGKIAINVDRGAGPRRVMEWGSGEVSGMLPYSRMTGPPGHNFADEPTEMLSIHSGHFPEMTHRCPEFTAHCVHLMLDRARRFNASALHDEKMVALGRLAAGLAHELNNPASATVRGSKLLQESLLEADAAARALGAAVASPERFETMKRALGDCLDQSVGDVLSPIEQADREDEIADWLIRHGSSPAHAAPLASTTVTTELLDDLAGSTSGDELDAVLRWIAAGCTTRALARDIESAATRIYELVGSVKKFTYMDNLAGPEWVDVEAGLRDTVRVLSSKARSKGASITLEVEPDLPRVHANGGELNQVWLNLIDNALDAIADSGAVEVVARREVDRVVVRVIDDGPGIPEGLREQIFDPFFTTKPPGQGTGLGLEITRRLLAQHNGELSLDSRPGRTEFRVSLAAEDTLKDGRHAPGGADS